MEPSSAVSPVKAMSPPVPIGSAWGDSNDWPSASYFSSLEDSLNHIDLDLGESVSL